ncbi:MAG: ribosomal L7Ae/L30e/S12e/Gadd45 family protein [Nanoarchaeota archaeon]|nr:ribosomal L7Ae/L30e/S12e/Gadd45 family protein [DPANN group archaeon]MBL7116447.1 ribosomal L7Ae/L30e/S12e/Gadd45 family protein [Nanoarchaeota archaeon]
MKIGEIKKILKSEKLLIGTDRVLKNLRNSKVEKVFVSSNCAKDVFDDINHFASFSEASVEQLDIPNDELGVVCKKSFSVSVIGILR